MKSTTPLVRNSGLSFARKAACLLASLALVAGLLPDVALADEPAPVADDPSVEVVGTPGVAKGAYSDAFGAEAQKKNPALNELCNLTFVGPYRFNIAGNTVVRGKYDNTHLEQSVHADPAAEGLIAPLADLNGHKVGGFDGVSPRTNSSSAVLEAREGTSADNIMAAYLVVTATQHTSFGNGGKNPLIIYGAGLKGPQGSVRHYYPEYLFTDNTLGRAACFFEVTDFVREQGYGTYTGVNIPCTPMGGDRSGSDYFGAWKLIVVEKDAELPVRMIRLMLGGTSVAKSAAAKATISGNGLSIASNPTGEVLASMDGTDIDDHQSLNLGVTDSLGASSTPKAVRYVDEKGASLIPWEHFFAFRIFNKDNDVKTMPGASSTDAANGDFPAGSPIYNTDFSLVDLDRLRYGGTDNKVLKGGETSVTATVSTSGQPTLLSALGLAADILVPEFETSLTITNLTQQYSTADADYGLKTDYAQAGDRLKATVRAVNTSRAESLLGLENASITVKAPAFAHIFNSAAEGSEVVARYYSGYEKDPDTGEVLPDFELSVASISEGTIVVTTPNDAKMNKIKPGGYFEIIFEGTAKGSETYCEYTNEAALRGAFIDEEGDVHQDFVIEDLGLVETKTSSDVPRYPVEASWQGSGTVEVTGQHEPTGLFDAEGSAQVAWTPDPGWRVATVVVDGVVRDDLLGAGSFALPIAGAGHTVMVTFAKDDPATSDEPGGKPDPDQDVFRIATKGDEGVSFITPTANALKGSSADVAWTVAPGYRVTEVLVDGQPYAAADALISFRNIGANHAVEVRTASDLYTITTVKQGPGTITATQVVRGGADATVDWAAGADARVIRVVVDGVLVYDRAAQELDRDPGQPETPAPLSQAFADVRADHVVEVTFQDDDPAADPDPDDPSLRLTTSLVGGVGSISPSTEVKAGDSESVSWNVAAGYFVKSVAVVRDGVRHVLGPGDYTMTGTTFALNVADIQSNCQVQVVLSAEEKVRDDLYAIDTSIYGGPGTITGSMANLEAHSSGHKVEWAAAPGWRVASVHVDGVPRDDLLTGTSITFDDITANHRVVVSVQPADTLEVTGYYSIDVTCEGNGTAGKSASVAYDGSHTVTWEADAGEEVLRVVVDGIERPDLVEDASSASLASPLRRARVAAASGSFAFSGVRADHKVHVVFSVADPDATKRFRVSTSIGGGSGTISEAVTVDEGASHTVTWTVAEGSEVAAVYVDGKEVPVPADGRFTFDDIDADHTVRVVLRAAPPENLPDKPPAGYHEIATGGSGKGEVNPPVHVPEGGSHTVTWKGEDGKPPLMVWVDGEPRPDLVDKGGVTFDDVDGPHEVYVQFEGGDPYVPDDDDDPAGPNPPAGPDDGNGPGGSTGEGNGGGNGGGSDAGAGPGGSSGDTEGPAAGAGGGEGEGALVPRLIALAQTGDGSLALVASCAAVGSLAVLLLAARRRRPARPRR
ncbi:MAG: hypothetical protein HFJ74_09690 [Eggerthellaceae bacterium]|nr:hypothetical protein [Eggerthellaceae bacterium]